MRSCLILLALTLFGTQAHAQWDIEESHTTASLRGIHNVGGGVAWASGTDGTVLRTEDGGYLWQTCAMPPGAEKLDFRGVQAFDENTAIVMSSGPGDQSRLYKTTDGCQTWKLIFTNRDKDGFWDAIRFDERVPQSPSSTYRNHLSGVLVGDPVNGDFVIFETSDSGDTWWPWPNNKSAKPAKALPKESMFAASNSSLIVPGFNEKFVFVTGGANGSRLIIPQSHDFFDGGLDWTSFATISLPFLHSESSGAFSIAAAHQSINPRPDVMVVGGDYKHPDSTDANAFFIPSSKFNTMGQGHAAQTPPHGYRSSVAYDADQKLWITVGPNGTDISTDDGKNWRPLIPSGYDPPDTDKNWNALSLPFVVGPHGRIGKLRTITPNPPNTPTKPGPAHPPATP